MNTPKLPPFPWGDDFSAWLEVRNDEEVQAEFAAYAIAAIEAQGVPDGWQLVPTDAELTGIYKKANGEDIGKAQPLTTQRIFKAMRAMLESTPPAPQADNWRKYATEREDTSQTVIERHSEEIQSLLNLLAKARKELAELKASVVQQEPVGYVTPETLMLLNQFADEDWCAIWNRQTSKVTVPLYTRPAQQTKPQPILPNTEGQRRL